MTTKVQRWGNSMGIRLPKELFASGQISEGSLLTLNQKGSKIILKVAKPKQVKKSKLPSLKEVMKGMTKANFEGELDWGPDVGKEIIQWE